MTPELEKQILVAGVGNAWLQDDAFGGECARRLEAARRARPGVTVMDFGTGGLDLAYEVMRGYDALDPARRHRARAASPGRSTSSSRELADFGGPIEDGEVINPHGMDPATVLRFVNAIGGFSGKVVVIGCEPGEVDDVGLGLTPPVEAAVERALGLVAETIDELRTDAAYQA